VLQWCMNSTGSCQFAMFEQHECLVFLPLEPKDDLGVQPFIGAARGSANAPAYWDRRR